MQNGPKLTAKTISFELLLMVWVCRCHSVSARGWFPPAFLTRIPSAIDTIAGADYNWSGGLMNSFAFAWALRPGFGVGTAEALRPEMTIRTPALYGATGARSLSARAEISSQKRYLASYCCGTAAWR